MLTRRLFIGFSTIPLLLIAALMALTSIYAAPALQEAGVVSIVSVQVTPNEITFGESTTIFLVVENTTGGEAVQTFTINLDGQFFDDPTVTLGTGETQTFQFTITEPAVGSHEVEVDGLVAVFVVSVAESPAVLSLVPPLTITPADAVVVPDESVVITVTVQNDGDESGDTEIIVRVNGDVEETRLVTVPGNSDQVESFEISRTAEGDYTVEVEAAGDTLSLGFTVEAVEVIEEVEEVTVGLFGTVTALVDSTIVLDTGEIIATDENTLFFLVDGSAGSLADIFIDDRLAIIALELGDGSLIATEVSLTSDEAVTTTTFIGIVTETGDGVATITDDEGNSITVEIPEGIELVLGDLVTVFLTSGGNGEEPTVTDIAFIDDVVDRLLEELETSTGDALEELEGLLEENGDEQVTRLANALEVATDQAKFNLETALDNATSRLEQVFEGAGINGPFVRVEGFIIALAVDEPTTGDGQGAGSIDIGLIDDREISLIIVEKTKITDPVEVGDFVEVRYNLALVAKSIDLASDVLTFEGTIATLSETDLVFEDGTSFVINEDTDVDDPLSSGDKVTVEALPTEGQLVALEVKLTDDEKGKSRKKDATGDIELKGIITALSCQVDPIIRTAVRLK